MKKTVRYVAVGVAVLGVLALGGIATADDDLEFESEPSGAQEVTMTGGTATDADGKVTADFDDELSKVRVRVSFEDLEGEPVAAHFHCARAGQNGPVAFGLVSPGPCEFDGRHIRCTLTNADVVDATGNACMGSIGRPVTNIAALAFAMKDGLIYFNLHTTEFGSGEIRGQMLLDD